MFYKDERLALFIDGSNLYAAAKALGFDIDYKLLRQEFVRRGKMVRAFYYTALLENDEYSPIRPLVDWLHYNGFTMVTKPAKEYTDSQGRRKVKGNMAGMVLVDIVVANLWMAIILLGIGRNEKIDKWLGADVTAITTLKDKVASYAESVTRTPSLADFMIMLAIAFGAVGVAHWGADSISAWLVSNFEVFSDNKSSLASFASSFFWMISIATAIGILLSFTKFKTYEGAGASKIGSIFIYILVATIGMKMDLTMVFDNPGLIAIGLVWMTIHAILLIIVAKFIKAPYFFLAVGSQANVGGAASAPVVAAAFHPSLATVGVLLAVFGYVVGTYGAILSTILMQLAAAG